MYCKYFNCKLSKKDNFVGISANEECVLEKEEDDYNFEFKKPKFLIDFFDDKLSLFHFDQYHIFTIKVSSPTKITDYKKIWGLGGFQNAGIYEVFYDIGNERIYCGIYKGIQPQADNVSVDVISVYVPNNTKIYFDALIKILQVNCYEPQKECSSLMDTLKNLQKSVKNSIVIYQFPRRAEIYAFGENIQDKFNCSDLPKKEIIE